MIGLKRVIGSARFRWERLQEAAVKRGAPAGWFGYRWVESESVKECVARCDNLTSDGRTRHETIHPPSVSKNPLPENVSDREELPDDRGWWHFSFRDVPERSNGETFRATLADCRVAPCLDEKNEFRVTILNRDGRALDLREMAFRSCHTPVLRARNSVRRKRVTWICERVYHNHSHWLTAHLPKLLLLRDRDELEDVLLPEKRTRAIDESLRLFGFDPDGFETFSPGRPIDVDELTVLGTDRFRPELLRLVGAECPISPAREPWRRIFISRAGAKRRRLLNEDDVWPVLEKAGFERVRMEELGFAEQVALMRETAVLVAPHGAGLTNMLFCPPGAQVVEIADLSFPNPNFYATAAAMGLPYWLLPAEGVGDRHPLEKDLRVAPESVAGMIAGMAAAGETMR